MSISDQIAALEARKMALTQQMDDLNAALGPLYQAQVVYMTMASNPTMQGVISGLLERHGVAAGVISAIMNDSTDGTPAAAPVTPATTTPATSATVTPSTATPAVTVTPAAPTKAPTSS